MTFNHRQLCEIGAKWLRSGRHHQCKAVLIDPATCDEKPDAIGFRYFTPPFGSVVIEAKTSRADFLADKGKPHRAKDKGMGKWRYFLCPTDVIKHTEVPEKWGLLYVSESGRVKVIKGAYESQKYVDVCENMEKYAFEVRDIESELRILGSNLQFMMYNEENGLTYKELYKRHSEQVSEVRRLQDNNEQLKRQVERLERRNANLESNLKMSNAISEIRKGEIQSFTEHGVRTRENHEY